MIDFSFEIYFEGPFQFFRWMSFSNYDRIFLKLILALTDTGCVKIQDNFISTNKTSFPFTAFDRQDTQNTFRGIEDMFFLKSAADGYFNNIRFQFCVFGQFIFLSLTFLIHHIAGPYLPSLLCPQALPGSWYPQHWKVRSPSRPALSALQRAYS